MVEVASEGFSAVWLPQSSGFDALTVLTLVGREVRRRGARHVGRAHVPTPSGRAGGAGAHGERGDRFTAGARDRPLAPGHDRADVRVVVRPPRAPHARVPRRARAAVARAVRSTSTARPCRRTRALTVPGATAPTLLLAALQPRMLALGGRRRRRDDHLVHGAGHARASGGAAPRRGRDGGRTPAPRVVVALPTIVTDDEAHGRAAAGEQLAGYGDLPVYRAGARRRRCRRTRRRLGRRRRGCGDRTARAAAFGRCHRLHRHPHGDVDDRRRTLDHLASLAR